ncbi:hypothetical protein [Streptomyces sp. NPDC059564]|uniref:hypothetical protein n=1 Tax=Streptomyces sp. NPDC059564 TaxID=3346865 RepID=UPI00367980B0
MEVRQGQVIMEASRYDLTVNCDGESDWRERVQAAFSRYDLLAEPPLRGSYAGATPVTPIDPDEVFIIDLDGEYFDKTRAGAHLADAKLRSYHAGRLHGLVAQLKFVPPLSAAPWHTLPSAGRHRVRDLRDVFEFGRSRQGRQSTFGLVEELTPLGPRLSEKLKQQARAYESQAKISMANVLRELGVLHFRDAIEPPILETSPCGVARLRAPIVPRPPTVDGFLHVPVRFALAA